MSLERALFFRRSPGSHAFAHMTDRERFLDADHFGRSMAVPMSRTARDLVSDLHALLQTAHVPGPYVFAAHSFGGIFARLYASTYPKEIVGMVLVDDRAVMGLGLK